ncbi:MAG: GNAT family protein [Desulfatiglandales bacterium]
MLWKWQFTEGPFVRGTKDVGVVITEAENVIGFNGFMPVSLQYNGSLIEGAWSCDTIISPRHRGKGFGRVMAKAVMVRFPIVMGLGISDIQAYLMKKSGYKVCQDIDHFYYTQKTRSTKDVVKKGVQYITNLKNTAKRPSTTGLRVTSKNLNF